MALLPNVVVTFSQKMYMLKVHTCGYANPYLTQRCNDSAMTLAITVLIEISGIPPG